MQLRIRPETIATLIAFGVMALLCRWLLHAFTILGMLLYGFLVFWSIWKAGRFIWLTIAGESGKTPPKSSGGFGFLKAMNVASRVGRATRYKDGG